MAQNVTHYFQVGAGVDLAAGVCMTECMSANDRNCHSRLPSIESYPMTDSTAGQRFVRYLRADKNPACLAAGRTFCFQVGSQRSCNRRKKGQLDSDSRFRPAQPYDLRLPINIFEL
jgi:hypothetical protein